MLNFRNYRAAEYAFLLALVGAAIAGFWVTFFN